MKQLIIEKKDLQPSQPNFEVLGVFNPAVIRDRDRIIMIARVSEAVIQDDENNYLVPVITEGDRYDIVKLPRNNPQYDFSDQRLIKNHRKNYLTSISHFRIATSNDGIHFDFSAGRTIHPHGKYEEYGIEDPRITKIDDYFYITYTGVSSYGINVRLMKTKDFVTYEKLGNIFHPDNKDCVIFPEKIHNKYVCLHRPSLSQFAELDIWLAESENLLQWGNHKVMKDAAIDYMESNRVGAGSVPFLTDRGWVEIYHSANRDSKYVLVAMLLDKDHPEKVLMKSKRPLVSPTEPYEIKGFVGGVVFTCGHLVFGDRVMIYYGVSDENIALCTLGMNEIWDSMKEVV